MVDLDRTVYWSKQCGSVVPLDQWLGIVTERYSPGVREMACRLSLNAAFVPGSEHLARAAQLRISHSAIRDLVLREGTRVHGAIGRGLYRPDWTAQD